MQADPRGVGTGGPIAGAARCLDAEGASGKNRRIIREGPAALIGGVSGADPAPGLGIATPVALSHSCLAVE